MKRTVRKQQQQQQKKRVERVQQEELLTVVPSTATYTFERLEYTSMSNTLRPLAGLRGVSMLAKASSE